MFIGLPCRDRAHPLTMAVTVSPVLQKYGGRLGLKLGCPWIDIARTDIVAQFLATTEEHLLFVDDDVWFDPSVVTFMLAVQSDVLTCTYRKRTPPHEFCLRPLGSQKPHAERLRSSPIRIVPSVSARVLEIESDGLGCCLIRRYVLEKMISCYPELRYVDDDGTDRYWLFQPFVTTDADGTRRPACDDKSFFIRARESGFKVECLIDATLFHDGIEGNFGKEYDRVVARLERPEASASAVAYG